MTPEEMNEIVYKSVFTTSLASLFRQIKEADTNYQVRNPLIYQAVAIAQQLGFEVGFRIDSKELGWPVTYIELPTGQVSWHLPQHVNDWDGHTTEEKYARTDAYVDQVSKEMGIAIHAVDQELAKHDL